MAGNCGGRGMAAVCVLGVAIVAIGSGVASGAKLKTKSASTTVPTEDVGSATAKCKKGTKAVSGGFEGETRFLEGPVIQDGPVIPIYESRRSGGREWGGSGMDLYEFDNSGELTVYAYCRDEKVKRRSSDTSIPSYDTGGATATCPKGTKAISGGFHNPDFGFHQPLGPGIFPYISRKSDKRTWTVEASDIGNDDGTLEVFVYCREGKGLRTESESVFNDHADTYTLTPRCERGRRVVSGGFAYTLPAAPDSSEGPFVYESRRLSKREWIVSGYNDNALATLTAYAYCEKA